MSEMTQWEKGVGWWPIDRLKQHAAELRELALDARRAGNRANADADESIAKDVEHAAAILGYFLRGEAEEIIKKKIEEAVASQFTEYRRPPNTWLSERLVGKAVTENLREALK